jgi:Cdc6-like AAA superfamily ATPase
VSIKYVIRPEPFTLGSRKAEPLVIESAASRYLLNELLRYCDGEISGRSFLIAGHRGAGKTTLVNSCVEKVVKAKQSSPRRPLVIRLYGPSLVTGSPNTAAVVSPEDPVPDSRQDEAARNKQDTKDGKAAKAADLAKVLERAKTLGAEDAILLRAALHAPEQAIQEMKASREKKADQADPGLQPLQSALKQITLALHRALSDEIIESYRQRTDSPTKSPSQQNDLFEHAAQLQLELDKYATPDVLRRHWEAGGFLQSGVLFTGNRPPDQGFRELVALASSCEAFSRVSGNFSKADITQSVGGKQSTEVGTGKDGVDFITPIVSLLAGGVTGTAAFAGTDKAITATVAGFIAALGAATVFKYSSSRSQTRDYSANLTFVPDLSVATLNRVVPTLIQRVHDAGLAPVIIIDELDKIPTLYDELDSIIRHVKNLITENAFFCFLTDRNYYERITQQSLEDPYPRHSTYFTDRIFVSFQTDDLQQYLTKAFETDPVVLADAEDVLDLEVLPYVAMRRAEMHAIELRRQLGAWRDGGDRLKLKKTDLRFLSHYLFDLYVQVAIQQVLADPITFDRMSDDPAFSRLAHDALYYPLRKLRQNGSHVLDLSDSEIGTFRDYLIERMSSEHEDDEKEIVADGDPETDDEYALQEADIAKLYELTRRLAAMLADAFLLLDEIERNKDRAALTTSVRESLPLNPPAGPLLRRTSDRYRYEWRYDANMQPREDRIGGRLLNRTPLAHQLDLEYHLAVRLTLLADPDPVTQRKWRNHRAEIEALLWAPYDAWLRKDAREIDIASKPFAQEAISRAPGLATVDRMVLLHTLGRLLSNRNEFYTALTPDLWQRYEPPLPLPDHEPFIARDPANPSKWSFNFDRDGYWAGVGGNAPSDGGDWQLNVQLVNDFIDAMRRFLT